MSKRRTFTPEQKANIVLELLKESKTINELAAEYEIHPNQQAATLEVGSLGKDAYGLCQGQRRRRKDEKET